MAASPAANITEAVARRHPALLRTAVDPSYRVSAHTPEPVPHGLEVDASVIWCFTFHYTMRPWVPSFGNSLRSTRESSTPPAAQANSPQQHGFRRSRGAGGGRIRIRWRDRQSRRDAHRRRGARALCQVRAVVGSGRGRRGAEPRCLGCAPPRALRARVQVVQTG